MTPKLLFAALLMCFATTGMTQGLRTDSLMAVLDTATNDRRVKALNELYGVYVDADPVKAFGYAREALNAASEIDDKRGLGAAYNNLGVLYRKQGALDKALDYYITSLKIYEGLGNKLGIASTKNNISTIYSIKKDLSQAMKYLEESHQLLVELNDERRVVGSLNNLGILNNDINMREKAIQYFTEASALSEKLGMPFSDPFINVGNMYFDESNYQRAVEFYERGLKIVRDVNDRSGVLKIVTNLGITYVKAKQPRPAKTYLDEALALCNDLQAYAELPSIYKAMSENEANLGNYKAAYDLQLKYDEARQKIYTEESSRNIAQMEMVIEFQEKEQHLESLEAQSKIDTLELRNTRLFIVVVVILVLAVIGGFNFYYINKKQSLQGRKKIARALSRQKE